MCGPSSAQPDWRWPIWLSHITTGASLRGALAFPSYIFNSHLTDKLGFIPLGGLTFLQADRYYEKA